MNPPCLCIENAATCGHATGAFCASGDTADNVVLQCVGC
jgi:hypothetical protein